MPRTCLYVAALALFLTSSASAQQPPSQEREQTTPSRPTFEYALLTVESLTTGLAVRYTADGVNTRATFFEFYESLGGTKERPAVTTADILNLLGRKGWELVDVRDHLHDFAVSYHFKRQR